MRIGKTTTALLFVMAITTGCARETIKTVPPITQYDPNWTWTMLESATDTTDFNRAYRRFNEEKRNPALAAEAYAGIAMIALFAPDVMELQPRESKQQALLFSEKAIVADPASPKAQYSRGLALSAVNKYDQAETFLLSLSPRAATSCDYYILATDIAIRKDGLLNAFPAIRRALDCKPRKYATYILSFAAARAMSQAGNYTQSEAYFQQAISIKRHDPVLYTDYAKMLMASGNLTAALEYAHKAASMQNGPQTQELISLIHLKTAENYQRQEKYSLAEAQYRLAIAYNINNTDAYSALMTLYADNLNMCHEALTCADVVLERKPQDQQAQKTKEKCQGS